MSPTRHKTDNHKIRWTIPRIPFFPATLSKDINEFQTSQGYRVRPCLKKKKKDIDEI